MLEIHDETLDPRYRIAPDARRRVDVEFLEHFRGLVTP